MPELHLVRQYTYKDILKAYLDCRRRKRTRPSAVEYELFFEQNLQQLLTEINSGTYEIGQAQCFVVTHPKPREVWAANFRDRIVHHLVYNSVAPWYESRFIENTYSCIKGRGTFAANKKLQHFLRSATQNWSKPAWCLQMDIANFFVSIDKQILWNILANDIGTNNLTARLFRQIIFHPYTENVFIRTPRLLPLVPARKSLFKCGTGCGLCIGNLTSQFLSNVYLDGLDKFIKHTLKVKRYVRYVDDLTIVSTNREELYYLRDQIDTWLQVNRATKLHPNKTTIKPANASIDFVGYINLPYRTYIRRMTQHTIRKTVKRLHLVPYDDKALCSIGSYLGILRATNSYNLRKHICAQCVHIGDLSTDINYTKLLRHHTR